MSQEPQIASSAGSIIAICLRQTCTVSQELQKQFIHESVQSVHDLKNLTLRRNDQLYTAVKIR